ncbi:MAG: hypothetical protein HC913_00595 [Microscillaceae bacterium]|nr:hypothetical protein [Microscillaceae bacterium]
MSSFRLLFLALTALLFLAQCEGTLNPDASGQFIKFFGGALDNEAFGLAATPDGQAFVIVGTSASFAANDRLYVAKADQNGNRLWERTFASDVFLTSDQDTLAQDGRDVKLLANGNILVLGNIRSNRPDFQEFSQFLLVELNSDGVLLRSAVLGQPFLRQSEDFFLQVAQNGDILLMANTRTGLTEGDPRTDLHLLRLAYTPPPAAWNIVFERSYGLFNRDDQNGNLREIDGNDLLWCGTSNRNTTFSDMRHLRADLNGNLKWDFIIGENDQLSQKGEDVVAAANPAEGFVLIGTTTETAGNANAPTDILLVKVAPNGTEVWQRIIGPSGSNQTGRSLSATPDGVIS